MLRNRVMESYEGSCQNCIDEVSQSSVEYLSQYFDDSGGATVYGEVQASRSSGSLVCTNGFTAEFVNKVSIEVVMFYLRFNCDLY